MPSSVLFAMNRRLFRRVCRVASRRGLLIRRDGGKIAFHRAKRIGVARTR